MTYSEAANEPEQYCIFGYRYHATTAQANRVIERVMATEAWIRWQALNSAINASCPRESGHIDHVARLGRDLAYLERELFSISKLEASRELELGG